MALTSAFALTSNSTVSVLPYFDAKINDVCVGSEGGGAMAVMVDYARRNGIHRAVAMMGDHALVAVAVLGMHNGESDVCPGWPCGGEVHWEVGEIGCAYVSLCTGSRAQ